jgi:predicted enzyme related to lactoylglutathione lyase
VRQPGYGAHLAATVNPDILKIQSDVNAPPGFEDAIAWMGIVAEGHPERWQVSFTIADRDASAALVEDLGGTVVETEDSEWTKTATVRDPHGAEFVLSQFTPPGG